MEKRKNLLVNNQGGFTLIEIIAVLVILGILAAVAVPKYMDLQNEARIKAAEGAIAEVKSRLSLGYGQYLLNKSGAQPADVAALCGFLNNVTILPLNANGAVPMGGDYVVNIAPTATDPKIVNINVTSVNGVAVTATSTWTLPQ